MATEREMMLRIVALIVVLAAPVAGGSDRFVEFSSRTLPRLDQLPPAPVPTVLAGSGGSGRGRGHGSGGSEVNYTDVWTLVSEDHTLRPSSNPLLCLVANAHVLGAGVSLFPCANMSAGRMEVHEWEWVGDTHQFKTMTAASDVLCLCWAPAGIPETLSLTQCDNPGGGGTQWMFVPPSSPMITTRGDNGGGGAGHDTDSQSLLADSVHPGVRDLIERFTPVFASDSLGADDERVLVGCFGWMIDLAVEFTGSPQQQLPVINPEAPQWSTGNATYADLQLFVRELRTASVARGLRNLRLGVLFVGWGEIYNLRSRFSVRHPEIYSGSPSRLAHGYAWNMTSDTYPYATRPGGVAAGSSFYELFGAQWAVLAEYLGFDLIVLRDGLSYYANHGRHGPFGDTAAPNASANQPWLGGVRELFRQTKRAAPNRLVLGYSLAASAVAQWTVALSDLEQVVADGDIDAWVDQSWAGAWEDVPTRASKTLGWTYHLAYILVHRAQIEGGNRRRSGPRCKHYVLHGTFDAFEGFDTIHKVPQKLQWGVMAYAMTVLVRSSGELVFSDGHYISWANSYSYVTGSLSNPLDDDSYLDRPTGLLTRTDVAWLADKINAADASVARVTTIAGPTAVYDRASLEAVMETHSADNVAEWLDEQLGLLLKYGVPLLKIARLEDGIAVAGNLFTDGVILSVPSVASPALVANLTTLAAAGVPVVLLGRCDYVAPALRSLAGAECGGAGPSTTVLPPYYGSADFLGHAQAANISLAQRVQVTAVSGAHALVSLPNGDAVMTRRGDALWAQLNDYTSPVTSNLAIANYGSALPHWVLATQFEWPSLHVVAGMTFSRPITVHMWRESTNTIVVLAGNLEGNFCRGPCSVPTQLSGRSVTVQIDTRGTSGSMWVWASRDPSVSQHVLYAAADGRVNASIELAFDASRVYSLTAVTGCSH